MTEKLKWPALIGQLVLVKQELAAVDTAGLWEHAWPRVKADEASIAEAERALGEPLDAGYRDFLLHADGWPAISQDHDLFGTEDLRGSAAFRSATERLGHLEEMALAASAVRLDDVYPIAASRHEIDIFSIGRRGGSQPGVVIWFAGTEIDRFPTFAEFFLALVEYNRYEIEQFRGGNR